MHDPVAFGGGATESVMHPLVLALLLISAILIFVLPPKKVVIPILLTIFLVPLGQQLYIAGVHFLALRIVVICGILRAMMIPKDERGNRMAEGWSPVDSVFSAYIIIMAVDVFLNVRSFGAFVNSSALVLDALGGYFVLRTFIKGPEEVNTAIKALAAVAVVAATGMMIEQKTMTNVFGLLQGVSLTPEVRDGRIRSQGSFQHALTAGAFATTALPLFFLIWKNKSSKVIAAIGILAATVMTFTTSTSSSVLSYLAAILAVIAWPLRQKMQSVRRGIVVALVGLAMVMNAPVWFVIAHIDVTGSSSSYHRAALVDQFIRHFWDWWMMGSRTGGWGWDMWDVQNQYVSVGVAGGLAAFIAFLLVIIRCFSRIGNAMKSVTSNTDLWAFWLLGGTLFVDVVAFFGVNFFDQVRFLWCAVIAIIVALTAPYAKGATSTATAETVSKKPRIGMKRSVPALRL